MRFFDFLEHSKDGLFHRGGKVLKFTEDVVSGFQETVPFVFTPEPTKNVNVEHYELDEPIDLPFKKCFFEMLDSKISAVTENGETIFVYGIWINEVSPRHYEVLGFIGFSEKKCSIIFADGPLQDHFLKIIKHLIGRIGKEEVGFNNPRHVVKMKVGGKKIFHRINRVVYVAPKRETENVSSKASKQIDWSHRWTVRGHWREIPGRIGKDREGNPISNNTWVTSYVKGPESAPIIQKTRIVKE